MNIKEIAQLCGVSVATVSRVLNKRPGVSEAKRHKIEALIKANGYAPDPAGRALSSRKSWVIGVLLSTLENPFYAEILAGIESVLRGSDYSIQLCCSDWDYETQKCAINNFMKQHLAGVLAVPMNDSLADFAPLRQKGPLILLDYTAREDSWNYICTNHVQGGALAAEYLIGQGHRRILILNPHRHQTCYDRIEGFIAYTRNELIAKHVHIDIEHGIESKKTVDKMLEKIELRQYTAVFCTNDIIGVYLIEALSNRDAEPTGKQSLTQRSWKVPQDITVFGYDDVSLAQYYRVPISTVSQAKRFMGELAATELLYQIQNGARSYRLKLQPELVLRQSCAAPRLRFADLPH